MKKSTTGRAGVTTGLSVTRLFSMTALVLGASAPIGEWKTATDGCCGEGRQPRKCSHMSRQAQFFLCMQGKTLSPSAYGNMAEKLR